jgi:hypothetical protein
MPINTRHLARIYSVKKLFLTNPEQLYPVITDQHFIKCNWWCAESMQTVQWLLLIQYCLVLHVGVLHVNNAVHLWFIMVVIKLQRESCRYVDTIIVMINLLLSMYEISNFKKADKKWGLTSKPILNYSTSDQHTNSIWESE